MGQALAAVDVSGEDCCNAHRDLRAWDVVRPNSESEITWTDFCSFKGLVQAQEAEIGIHLQIICLVKEGFETPFDFPGEGETGQSNGDFTNLLDESPWFVENMDIPMS
jgi:hypothetical protein